MSAVSVETEKRSAPAWGILPRRMRVLFITTSHRTGAWLAEAFATDSASEVILEESIGATAGMARLRDEIFDAVFISHEPPDLDALEFIQGLRAGGGDEPTVVLGAADDQEMAALTYEVGADAYLCVTTTTIRTLLWSAARAIERHQMLKENRRLIQAERQRLNFEHQEADRLLAQQRTLIGDLETLAGDRPTVSELKEAEEQEGKAGEIARSSVEPLDLPKELVAHYAELLRAYVIMGSGNLAAEMSTLADLLASAGVSPQQTMQLHLDVLEQLVRGLGSRSARHVMSRADLLVLEVMIHLAEDYRQRYLERNEPPQQLTLPGV
jgi:DNA-binding NarL/FixJ family response regulator